MGGCIKADIDSLNYQRLCREGLSSIREDKATSPKRKFLIGSKRNAKSK
jgi:hypothetical protein